VLFREECRRIFGISAPSAARDSHCAAAKLLPLLAGQAGLALGSVSRARSTQIRWPIRQVESRATRESESCANSRAAARRRRRRAPPIPRARGLQLALQAGDEPARGAGARAHAFQPDDAAPSARVRAPTVMPSETSGLICGRAAGNGGAEGLGSIAIRRGKKIARRPNRRGSVPPGVLFRFHCEACSRARRGCATPCSAGIEVPVIVFRPVPSIGMCSVPGPKRSRTRFPTWRAVPGTAERAAGGEPVCTPVAVE